MIEGATDPEGVDTRFEDLDEAVVGTGEADDAFDADAVLACGLECPAHEDAGDLV